MRKLKIISIASVFLGSFVLNLALEVAPNPPPGVVHWVIGILTGFLVRDILAER